MMIDEAKIAAYAEIASRVVRWSDHNALTKQSRKLWDDMSYEERAESNQRYVEKVRAEAAADIEKALGHASALD
jgi:hypothetical protein